MNADWLRKCGIDLDELKRRTTPRPVVPKKRVESIEKLCADFVADVEAFLASGGGR